MKLRHGILISGLMLGLSAFGCSRNDYVKITDVAYETDSFKTSDSYTTAETEFTDHVVKVYRKAFDKDGIDRVVYFFDGKRMTTAFEGHSPGQTQEDVKELNKYPEKIRFRYKSTSSYIDKEGKKIISPTMVWNDLKGNHKIRLVLYDSNGETVEDTYDFNVK